MNFNDKTRYYTPARKNATPPKNFVLPERASADIAELASFSHGVGNPEPAAAGFDWDTLQTQIDQLGGIRNKVLVAERPLHPPIRLLTGVCEGLEPLGPRGEYFRTLSRS